MKSEKEIELEQRTANSFRLHQAIDKNDLVELEKILAKGNFDIDFQDKEYMDLTAINKIMLNCQSDKISENDALKMLQLLISYGADVNKIGWGCTPLFVSLFTSNGNAKPKMLLFDCLLEAKADVNIIESEGLATPLHAAKNNINIVKKLLAHGADMYLKNNGETPLDIVKESMRKEIFMHAKEYPGFDIRDIVHDFYMKAAFVDDLFNKASKNDVEESLSITLKLINEFSDEHIDFIRHRFKSLLCDEKF